MTVNTACQHKQAEHEHGTHACYVLDQCRCAECRRANTRYERHRTAWLAGAVPHPLVDADPARDIVCRLTETGIGLKTISSQSGVPHGVLWKLVYGRNGKPSRRVRRETMAKLQAYERVAEPADGAKVDAAEAWLIVDELVLRGWQKAAIGRRIHGEQAISLQLGRQQVQYGHLKTLRLLLDEPVPLRRSRHGEHEVRSDHEWRTLGQLLDRQSVDDELAPRRVLRCRVCARPLIDHGILERCAS